MITMQLENLTQVLASELTPLTQMNHRAAIPGMELELDWWALVKMPMLKLWVMRSRGQAVGYCAHAVMRHVFTGQRQATCMAIYVMPVYAGSVAQFIREIEVWLVADGVTSISYSVPHGSRASCFFERAGYDCSELVMTKRCGS